MKKISNTLYFNILLKLLTLFLLADLLSLVLTYYLPAQGVNNAQSDAYDIPYVRTNFQNMFADAKPLQSNSAQTLHSAAISDIVLKGLYGNEKTGFVIVSLKSQKDKTKIVAIGEDFHGYVLRSIALKSATFTRNGQAYTAYLQQPHVAPSFNVSANDGERDISRNQIDYYIKKPQEIWNNISIVDVRNGTNLNGFRVTRVNPASIFAKLGLRPGDVIVKANNTELHSYNDVIKLYQNINKLDAIKLVVRRNNQNVELIYAIH